MTSEQTIQQIVNELAIAHDISSQERLLERLRLACGPNYWSYLLPLARINPFLKLSTQDHTQLLLTRNANDLYLAKQLAASTEGNRVCIFCTPKSGSSFVQSSIQSALRSSFISLTSHTDPLIGSSLGMNGREQELDEFAVVSAILLTGGNFVAQHHTRCTPYLCRQLTYYHIKPVLTTRNIFDAIVSYDDMFMEWRGKSNWLSDGPITLPVAYASMPQPDRHLLLARTYGQWAINFFLSWKRCEQAGFVKPLWLSYENDILDKENLKTKLTEFIALDPTQTENLMAYVNNPDTKRSRLNKGVTGRGEIVPEAAKQSLIEYALMFGTELNQDDLARIFGATALQ